MSIILKGIDLPRNGDYHHITIYDNGNTYITTSNILYETDRKDVEAIQIPTAHGRLIDGDGLKTLFKGDAELDTYTAFHFLYAINDAPTILEAEEVDEHNTEGD